MRNPRQLLALVAGVMALVGWQTFNYPPEYLAFSWLWGTLAVIAALLCAVCAVHPLRLLVSFSGAMLVTLSSARALALVGELFAGDFPLDAVRTSFVIAAIIWLLVAVLFYIAWREYVVPWSIGSRR